MTLWMEESGVTPMEVRKTSVLGPFPNWTLKNSRYLPGKEWLKETPTAVRVMLLTSQLHYRMAAADAYECRSFLWSGASKN